MLRLAPGFLASRLPLTEVPVTSRYFGALWLVLAVVAVGCGGGSGPGADDAQGDTGRLDGWVADGVVGQDVRWDGSADGTVGPDGTTGDSGGRDTVGQDPGGATDGTDPGSGRDPGQGFDPGQPIEPCVPGGPCNDFDPCTFDDLCDDDGDCFGTWSEFCSDGIDCTFDECDGPLAEDCRHKVKPGWCLVDGECFEDGVIDPLRPCWACISAAYQDRLVPDDTLTCDDGIACTANDRCRGGDCIGTFMTCHDDNPCTSDLCVDGVCRHESLEGPCNDNSLCTVDDECRGGFCVGDPVECDDGNPCTDNTCDPRFGCVFVNNNASCDDGNICTVGDRCQGGACRPGAMRLACDDGNPCTTDTCSPAVAGGCLHIPNTLPCDDKDPCTIGDVCKRGECTPGETLLLCDDGNPCTDDVCEPGVGCVAHFNSAPCDDLEPCFLDDVCVLGNCHAGTRELDCDDGNICTDDFCLPMVGCQRRPNSLSCDDNNVCTRYDTCTAGVCVGSPVVDGCNDDDPCTADFCVPSGGAPGCGHKAMPECRPQIVIDYPLRASTLNGPRTFLVRGHIETNSDWLGYLVNINGLEMLTDPVDGTFKYRDPDTGATLEGYEITSEHGINPIFADAVDVRSMNPGDEAKLWATFRDHVAQSYYYSTKWYPVSDTNPDASMVFDGFKMFLGKNVWDDNDTSTPNDIATILTLFVQQMNIASLIQNPVTSGSVLHCKYKVNLKNIRYGKIAIDLVPINGGLSFKAIIPNFRVDIDVPVSGFLCPDFSGSASATSITIQANVMLSINAQGEPVATLLNPNVTVQGLNVRLDGIWGFLLNWIIDFFEDDFADMIEEEFEKVMAGQVADAIADAIKGLALDQTFEVPGFLPGAPSVTLRIKTKFSTLDFRPDGGVIGMSATIVTPKRVPYNVLGSIGRASCLGPTEPTLAMPRRGEIEIGLHDDFFNLVPYGLWYGGGLSFDIDPSMLGDAAQELGSYGISELGLKVDFRLPPILSACNPLGMLMMQMGDVSIRASMKMFGIPVQMLLFASLSSEARIVIENTPTGKQLGLQIEQPIWIDVEIAELDGGLVGAEDTLGNLIKEMLIPMVLAQLSGRTLASFPIPEIDLHAIAPEIPVGSKIAIDLREILRMVGNTVVSGDVR